MSFRPRQYVRRLSVALLLILLAAWLGPSFFSAERYRRRLEAGLVRTLHRQVMFGAIAFRLIPRPGLVIENAVVREDPAFGSEPFARVDRIQCDLRWRSLWHSRIEFSRLRLSRASFNLVRAARGEWNVGDLLPRSSIAAPSRGMEASNGKAEVAPVELVLDEARVNFKVGDDKKAFALTDLNGRIAFEAARGTVQFRLMGNPIRAGLSFPTPGLVELVGEWSPGEGFQGALDAMLRTRGGMLYDWIPLVTGDNPGIYGIADADVHLAGSIDLLSIEAEVRLGQIRRWEQLPPSDSLVSRIHIRGQLSRQHGHALIESLDASFGDSRIHLTGSLDKLLSSPELDLVAAFERSRIEDLLALGRRLWGRASPLQMSGRVDGLLTIQGPWNAPRYGGFIGAEEVRLRTPHGSFPVSDLAVQIHKGETRLLPFRVTLAPRIVLVGQGLLEKENGASYYGLEFSAKGVPLSDVVGLGRALGLRAVQGLDARGIGNVTFHLKGLARPDAPRPTLVGHAEVHAARLLVAGLTEPIEIPRADVGFRNDQITVDPITAAVGDSTFSGRLERRGERNQPWTFDLRADNLSLERAALWFDALGLRHPLPLLERLPGLRSFGERRVAASNLFGALNAVGRFTASEVSYRPLTLKNFRASVEISGRAIRISSATFRAGEGRGQGRVQIDLTSAPARIAGELTLTRANVRSVAASLPDVLQGVRGIVSGAAQFATLGLTREQISAGLTGKAAVRLENVSFGAFDPLESLVRSARAGILEPARGEVSLRLGVAAVEIRDRHIVLRECSLDIAGAKIELAGSYAFDQTAQLDLRADLHRVRRHWVKREDDPENIVSLHLAGPLEKLAVVPEERAARVSP